MALNIAAVEVELAAASRLDAARLTRAGFAAEIEAQRVVVADSWRRLLDECAELLRLVAAAALARVRMEHGALAQTASASEAAAVCETSSPVERTFDDVTEEDVAEGARRLADVGDVAENTRRAYDSALRCFDAWRSERRPEQALDDAALAEYLAVLASRGRSAASAGQVVAAVKRRAKQRSEASPAGKRTAEVLRHYRRSQGGAGPSARHFLGGGR